MEITEIEKRVQQAFRSSLGEQCDVIYSTSDGKLFIRKSEALSYLRGELEPDTIPPADPTILEWFEEWSGNDPEPKIRYI